MGEGGAVKRVNRMMIVYGLVLQGARPSVCVCVCVIM